MFDANYEENYEVIVTRWAKILYVIGVLLICLSLVVGLAMAIQDKSFILVLAISLGGIASGIAIIVSGHLIWGFAEMVYLTRQIAKQNNTNKIIDYLKNSK